MTPEARARQTIDALLTAAGWHVCDVANANLRAATGIAIREFPLDAGHGFAAPWMTAAALLRHSLLLPVCFAKFLVRELRTRNHDS